jgi:hypothetical protein
MILSQIYQRIWSHCCGIDKFTQEKWTEEHTRAFEELK